jgi:hypothetical protein
MFTILRMQVSLVGWLVGWFGRSVGWSITSNSFVGRLVGCIRALHSTAANKATSTADTATQTYFKTYFIFSSYFKICRQQQSTATSHFHPTPPHQTFDTWDQVLHLSMYGCDGYPSYDLLKHNPGDDE